MKPGYVNVQSTLDALSNGIDHAVMDKAVAIIREESDDDFPEELPLSAISRAIRRATDDELDAECIEDAKQEQQQALLVRFSSYP